MYLEPSCSYRSEPALRKASQTWATRRTCVTPEARRDSGRTLFRHIADDVRTGLVRAAWPHPRRLDDVGRGFIERI